MLLDTIRPTRVVVRYRIGDVLGAYRDIGPQRATFEQLAQLCWQDRKTDSLVALVAAHAKNDANDPKLAQARWRAKICQGSLDEAGAIMKTAVVSTPGEDERKLLREGFLFDMVDAKQVLAAYRFSADPAEAFGLIVNDLLDANKLADLKAVSEAHRQRFPMDPLMAICAAARGRWLQPSIIPAGLPGAATRRRQTPARKTAGRRVGRTGTSGRRTGAGSRQSPRPRS